MLENGYREEICKMQEEFLAVFSGEVLDLEMFSKNSLTPDKLEILNNQLAM